MEGDHGRYGMGAGHTSGSKSISRCEAESWMMTSGRVAPLYQQGTPVHRMSGSSASSAAETSATAVDTLVMMVIWKRKGGELIWVGKRSWWRVGGCDVKRCSRKTSRMPHEEAGHD